MNYNFDLDDNRPEIKKRIRGIIIWVVEIAAVIGLAFLLITYGVERTAMHGVSMEPTLSDGNSILINKLIYRISSPKRYDVVVFKQSGKEHSYYTIKRVIGLPGETIEIKSGAVFINGEPLEEKFNTEAIVNGGLAEQPLLLEDHEYFLIGDNRNNSEDSRFANIGPVLAGDILGKAWIRISPFDFVNQIIPAENNE